MRRADRPKADKCGTASLMLWSGNPKGMRIQHAHPARGAAVVSIDAFPRRELFSRFAVYGLSGAEMCLC